MLHGVVEEFAMHLRTIKRSEHTVKTYTLVINDLLRWSGKDPTKISVDDASLYQQHLALERAYKKNSLYTSIEAMVAFFNYIGTDAADGLSRPKRPMSTPRFITEDEVRRLIEAAVKDGPRNGLIVSILAYTGVRVSELCELKVTDLDVSNRTILVRSGKGDRDRLVVLPQSLLDAILEYVTGRPGVYLFRGNGDGHLSVSAVQRLVKKAATNAGIVKNVTPHVLRHTFATTILRRGGDIRFIQQLLGHRSVATTQIYTHVDDRMIRNMYDQYGPEY